MTIYEECRKVNCKHITCSNGGGDSCTFWFECKLKNDITDPEHCAKCKERVAKKGAD